MEERRRSPILILKKILLVWLILFSVLAVNSVRSGRRLYGRIKYKNSREIREFMFYFSLCSNLFIKNKAKRGRIYHQIFVSGLAKTSRVTGARIFIFSGGKKLKIECSSRPTCRK